MEDISLKLIRLCEEDANVAHILGVFANIDRVYQASQVAMGLQSNYASEVVNCAKVTVSFTPTSPGPRSLKDE